MKKSKIIIISNGEQPSLKLLEKEIDKNTTIICADGGANCLFLHNNYTPHFIIGDLDSINKDSLDYFKKKSVQIEKFPINKDLTDTQLALNKAIKLNATEITFFGCTGGERTDHFFGNLGILIKCLKYKIKAKILDNHNIITLLNKNTIIHGTKGEIFSVLAYGNIVESLSLKGSKYEIENYDLKLGDTLTLSNSFNKEIVEISFSNGNLLLIREQHD